jgi:ribosomal protein S18 acetylase RimI-like enzyme
MPARAGPSSAIEVYPLTPDRWNDLVKLFTSRGSGQVRWCWCMYYRRSGRAEVPGNTSVAEHNRDALKALVDAGTIPGLLGYRDGKPVAWVSLGPRSEYAKLAKSPVMRAVDDKPVWSVICFFTSAEARGQHVAEEMLGHAAEFARANGATLLEAYPVDKQERSRAENIGFGSKAMYDRAGFVEVARRKPTRVVMRKVLRSARVRAR